MPSFYWKEKIDSRFDSGSSLYLGDITEPVAHTMQRRGSWEWYAIMKLPAAPGQFPWSKPSEHRTEETAKLACEAAVTEWLKHANRIAVAKG